MIQLCRHIFNDNRRCKAPAVTNTEFCRHHQQVKTILDKIRPSAENYGVYKPLPFVFPEDRASIQTNLFLVLQAFNQRKIDTRTANSMTYNLQVSMTNLGKNPLLDSSAEDTVQRVILTPDGDEIAPPREALEKGETLAHGPTCPCRKCAEQYRNAPPELHHHDCQCGLCEHTDQPGCPILGAPSASRVGEQEPSVLSVSSVVNSEQDLSVLSASSVVNFEANTSKTATATRLCNCEPAPHMTEEDADEENDSLYDYESVRQIYWARQAAMEAGQEPPPWPSDAAKKPEPDTPKPEPYHVRRYNEIMEQVEKNKKIAEEIWRRRFPDQAAKQNAENTAGCATGGCPAQASVA